MKSRSSAATPIATSSWRPNRFHASTQPSCKIAGYEIKDLGSTRGTYVDGQKLAQPVFLKDGHTVQIGELLLTFSSRLVQIEEGDEQSTVFAAIDVLNQSDKHFPMVKPEVKFRALRLIGQELGGTLNLSEVLERIFNSLFEIFPRAERVSCCSRTRRRVSCCRRLSARAPGRPASSRSARRCSTAS